MFHVGVKHKSNVIFQAVLLLFIILVVWFNANTDEYVIPITVSLFFTWLGWLSSGRNPATFRGLTVIIFAIFYPGSAILNALLPIPTMHEKLWETGVVGLWAYCLGMAGLSVGYLIFDNLPLESKKGKSDGYTTAILADFKISDSYHWVWKVFVLISFFYFLSFLGSYYGGYYYHEYTDFESTNRWFFLGYGKYATFALSAILLQTYIATRSRIVLLVFGLAMFELFVFFGLGGGRGVLVFPILYWTVYAYSMVPPRPSGQLQRLYKIFVGICVLFFIIFINAAWAQFQAYALFDLSLSNRVSTLSTVVMRFTKFDDEISSIEEVYGSSGLIGHLGYRLQEFGYAGRTISYFRDAELVWFEGFQKIPEFLLPSFLRITPYWESTDVVAISLSINSDIETGAAPLTTIGDLYRRFGFIGLFFGMGIIGAILTFWDRFFAKPYLERRIHFLLFWFHILTVHITMGIQEFLVQSIRPFFITWIMAFVLARVIKDFRGSVREQQNSALSEYRISSI